MKESDQSRMPIPVFSSVFIRVHPWFEFFPLVAEETIRFISSQGSDQASAGRYPKRGLFPRPHR